VAQRGIAALTERCHNKNRSRQGYGRNTRRHGPGGVYRWTARCATLRKARDFTKRAQLGVIGRRAKGR